MKQWTLTDLAEGELRKLISDGITPTPQMVLDVQCLSLEAEESIVRSPGLAKGVPYELGGLTLYPLTLASSFFFARFCEEYDNELLRTYGYIYSLANGHNIELMEQQGETARKAVIAMAEKLTCTTKDIQQAIDFYTEDGPVVNLDKKSDKVEDNKAWLSYLSSTVVAFTGLSPDVVEYQMSIEYASMLVDSYIRSIGGSQDGKGLLGLRKLAAYIENVRQQHKLKKENG